MRILLGRAGSGKTHTILREIATAVEDDPLGPPIVLIVPDQVTFYMEKELIKLVSRGAVARAQVMSFRRLAWRGLQAVGGLPLEPIRKAGKYALVAAVLQDALPQLRALGRAAFTTAYIDRLMRLLEEFQAAGATAGQLRRLADDEGAPWALRLKMADLALISDGYRERIAGRFIDPHDLLPQFCARAQEWTMLAESTFYVDGFVGFTPQEYDVMQVLRRVSGSFTVALAMPAALAAAQNSAAGDAQISAQSADGAETDAAQTDGAALHSPFAQAQDVYRRLAAGAKKAGITPQLQTFGQSGSAPRFAQAPRIAHLEQRLYTLGAAQWNAGTDSQPEADLVVANAPTRRAEVYGVIAELVRSRMTRGVRWRDCAIIAADLAVYGPLIADACTDAGIPYFMDERRSLKHHPLSEFVLSALRLCAEGFAIGPLLR
ncbi:MAG: PD-(D/E)XK nuclease family protein, partial [Bacilli bacterium]